MKVFESLDQLEVVIFNNISCMVENEDFCGDTPILSVDSDGYYEENYDCLLLDTIDYTIFKEVMFLPDLPLTKDTTTNSIAKLLWDGNYIYKQPFIKHNFNSADDVLTKLYLSQKDDFYGSEVVECFLKEFGVEVRYE